MKWLAELVLVETKHSGKEECEKGRLWWLERAEQVLGPLPVEFVDGGERSILLSAPTPRESSTRARVRKEKIFACYDADNDGMLSFGELMHLAADVHAEFYPTATPLDEDALELEVMEILRQIEVHQDHCVGRWNGTVEFEEFLPWLAEQETKYLQTQPRPAVPSRASCLRFDALRSRMNLSRWRRIAKPLLPRLKSDAHAAAAGRLPRSRSHDDLLATSHEVQETSNGPNVLVRSRSEDDLLARESGRRETGKDEESEDVLKKFCHRLSSVSPRAGRNGEVARPGPGSRLWGGEHGRSEARNRLSACTRALTDQQPSSRRAVLPHTQGQDSEDPPSSRKSDEEVSRQPPSPREQATASAPRSALDALRDLVIAGGRASLVLAGKDEGLRFLDTVLTTCTSPIHHPHGSMGRWVGGSAWGKRIPLQVRELIPGDVLRLTCLLARLCLCMCSWPVPHACSHDRPVTVLFIRRHDAATPPSPSSAAAAAAAATSTTGISCRFLAPSAFSRTTHMDGLI